MTDLAINLHSSKLSLTPSPAVDSKRRLSLDSSSSESPPERNALDSSCTSNGESKLLTSVPFLTLSLPPPRLASPHGQGGLHPPLLHHQQALTHQAGFRPSDQPEAPVEGRQPGEQGELVAGPGGGLLSGQGQDWALLSWQESQALSDQEP